jgi:hypothetical protein
MQLFNRQPKRLDLQNICSIQTNVRLIIKFARRARRDWLRGRQLLQ